MLSAAAFQAEDGKRSLPKGKKSGNESLILTPNFPKVLMLDST